MLSAGGLSLRPSRPGWDGDGDGAGWAGPRGGTREVGMSPAALAAGLDAGGMLEGQPSPEQGLGVKGSVGANPNCSLVGSAGLWFELQGANLTPSFPWKFCSGFI